MKTTLLILSFLTVQSLGAKEIRVFEDKFMKQINDDYKAASVESDNKVYYLEKTLALMQRDYEAKINYLEVELNKTKDRLVQKSLNEEKIQDTIKTQYDEQINSFRKELAVKNRSILELQRMVEKIKPSEDAKNLIKLNTELAAELRKSEGQLAAVEMELKRSNGTLPPTNEVKIRKPASVEEK